MLRATVRAAHIHKKNSYPCPSAGQGRAAMLKNQERPLQEYEILPFFPAACERVKINLEGAVRGCQGHFSTFTSERLDAYGTVCYRLA
jgi:hypothetical protein